MWKKKKRNWQIRNARKIARRKKRNKYKSIYYFNEEQDEKKNILVLRYNAPKKFSIVKNPNETYEFFYELRDGIRKNKRDIEVMINLSRVEELTVDAIMYLLALVCNTKARKGYTIIFKGNQPQNSNANRLLEESGFYNYVRSDKSQLQSSNDKIQIISGQDVKSSVAGKIVEFINDRCRTKINFTFGLYDILIELMNNTVQHAYNGNELLDEKNWYLYAADLENRIKLVFLDTGSGIAETVNRKFGEKVKDAVNGRTEDNIYIESALHGELRSQTGEKNRGNGLPTIYKYAKSREISKFRIHSGKAICKIRDTGRIDSKDLKESLFGTLVYLEIKKDFIAKEYRYDYS